MAFLAAARADSPSGCLKIKGSLVEAVVDDETGETVEAV